MAKGHLGKGYQPGASRLIGSEFEAMKAKVIYLQRRNPKK
jgi:hypothetical protein